MRRDVHSAPPPSCRRVTPITPRAMFRLNCTQFLCLSRRAISSCGRHARWPPEAGTDAKNRLAVLFAQRRSAGGGLGIPRRKRRFRPEEEANGK